MLRYYYIYKNNELVKKGYYEDIIKVLPFSYYTLLRCLKRGTNYETDIGDIWSFKTEKHKSKVKPQEKPIDKEKKELDTIIRILEEEGNTNLIKREYNKYIDYLKEHYRLDIKYYPRTRFSKKVKLIEGSREDWIITWLDWGKNGES